jgi:hypothetical protein
MTENKLLWDLGLEESDYHKLLQKDMVCFYLGDKPNQFKASMARSKA